ncbi:MAG: tRNA epoxyqueuosine(34) reductase QueG, partial [Candidatus Puniceispirillaceae bacterium]
MAGDGDRLRRWLEDAAAKAGFAGVHVTDATLPPETGARLNDFVADGRQGDMAWLAETAPRRASPAAMWPEARSAIVLTMNYGPDHDPMDNLAARDRGNVSVYARGRDYHDVIKGRLKQLAGQFAAKSGADVKVFVDTAPLMEKPLAAKAGAGWQGKHTNLVSRENGSWLFLGTILTSAELAADSAETDHCGSCRKCLDACPTDAFPAPYQLDARRCISYLTIEHKGQIPAEFRAAIGNRIFGCDDCLAVCPWNKYAERAAEAKFHGPGEMPPLAAAPEPLAASALAPMVDGLGRREVSRELVVSRRAGRCVGAAACGVSAREPSARPASLAAFTSTSFEMDDGL